jgi:hypothetical protein
MHQEQFENRRFYCLEVCEVAAASTPRKSSAAAERHRKGEYGYDVKTSHVFLASLRLSNRRYISVKLKRVSRSHEPGARRERGHLARVEREEAHATRV